MTEITQADRDAAASVAVLPEMRDLIRAGRADYHAEPFARHRQFAEEWWYRQGREDGALSERQHIVGWLRDQDGHGYDDMRANCIEAGEHHAR